VVRSREANHLEGERFLAEISLATKVLNSVRSARNSDCYSGSGTSPLPL
jgi:hypothetical protein